MCGCSVNIGACVVEVLTLWYMCGYSVDTVVHVRLQCLHCGVCMVADRPVPGVGARCYDT